MNFLKKAAIAAAAFSMVASPVVASAAPVASFESARASAQLEDSSEQAGGVDAWIIALLALGLIFGGLAVGLGNHSNAPTSP